MATKKKKPKKRKKKRKVKAKKGHDPIWVKKPSFSPGKGPQTMKPGQRPTKPHTSAVRKILP